MSHRGLGRALRQVPEQSVVISQRDHTRPISHGLPQDTAAERERDSEMERKRARGERLSSQDTHISAGKKRR